MARCHDRYLGTPAWLDGGQRVVLDVGGADVNGGYRSIFDDPRYRYLTADLAAGEGVDVVLDDPYRLPFDDGSVDVVLSGQMLEHCEFFWLIFAEMMRVLKPDGYLFLIAPSAGPIHNYPVDCYRFYPDAYRALAKYAGCHVHEVWLDERGPWRDLVGVFAKHPPSGDAVSRSTSAMRALAPTTVAPGTAEEEATRGDVPYLQVLQTLHEALQPLLYLEIGVRRGRSLALARGPAIGVDPAAELEQPLAADTRLFPIASDDFFRDVAREAITTPPDLAFIDGMHLFEYALRDFMHVERLATPTTLVVVDDIFPSHPAQAERIRRTRVWTGDIWKLANCLAELRPDLLLIPLDTAPTGLLLVAGLDPDNRVLWNGYNPIVRRFSAEQAPPAAVLQRTGVLAADDPRVARMLAALRQCRDTGAKRPAVMAALHAALAKPHA